MSDLTHYGEGVCGTVTGLWEGSWSSRVFLTEEELGEVLAEQAEYGTRLGELLLGRRLASWPTLTRALADQQSLVLETDV